jgi:diguanylate cyclase (GGDEF)-like protein
VSLLELRGAFDIRSVLAAQSRDPGSRLRRSLRNILAVLIIFAASNYLDANYRLGDLIGEGLARGLTHQSNTIWLTAIFGLVTFLVFQVHDINREVARRRTAEAQAVGLAFHDPLTGLMNRRKFDEHLSTLPAGATHAVIMIDLDDFKPVNDIFGHKAGDKVLAEAATRIVQACDPQCLVARFGGDEFAVISPAISGPEDAEAIARRIAASFERPFLAGSGDATILASVGVTLFRPGEKNTEDAVREADLALYQAKDDVGSEYCVFDPLMEERLRRRKMMERKLRIAIAQKAIRPHFQPLVDLSSKQTIGFEALARWTDPELGSINPEEFIALAEECALITELSNCLLRAACREAVRWPPHIKLSFNLSPRQLRDKLVGLRILGILGETGLPAHRLEIEITEGSLVENKELAREVLASLRAAGVRIAIDDFGTGYSSLYHLREFRFDNLKIDRSFIQAMESGNDDAVIVQAILSLSRGLGLMATAEGIERPEQLMSLLSSGCQHGQGYLFGKAMSPDEALQHLAGIQADVARA